MKDTRTEIARMRRLSGGNGDTIKNR